MRFIDGLTVLRCHAGGRCPLISNHAIAVTIC